MALTPSTMLELGTPAPAFTLPDVVSGQMISLSTFGDRPALLVIFLCQHCPFVKHIKPELARLTQDYVKRGVGIVAISANDVEKYPSDAPEHLKAMATELQLAFPVCYDETQAVAKAYRAACTPDFFVFDQAQTLVYRGQLDDSRPGNDQPTDGHDVRAALDAMLSHQLVSPVQKPSIGCNIKWKAGNEPDYMKAPL